MSNSAIVEATRSSDEWDDLTTATNPLPGGRVARGFRVTGTTTGDLKLTLVPANGGTPKLINPVALDQLEPIRLSGISVFGSGVTSVRVYY